MGRELRKSWTSLAGMIVVCCAAAFCFGEDGCKTSCCNSCDQAESDCSACQCPEGECPSCCEQQGCQQNCCEKTAAQVTPAILVVDVDLLSPAVPVTLSGLAGGTLPSDRLAQLATNPTGLAGCCQTGCCGDQCASSESGIATTGTVAQQVWAIRNLLQHVPQCTIQLDPETFSLISGHTTESLVSEAKIVVAQLNELEQGCESCCCAEKCKTRQQAAQQLTEIAATLEQANLTDEAARTRQLAEQLTSGSTSDNQVEEVVELAQPPQSTLLR